MKRIDSELLKSDLLRVALHLGKNSVTAAQYGGFGAFTVRPFIRAFGSWNGALVSCGLAIGRAGTIRRARQINMNLRYKVLKRDKYRCVFCGASPAKDGNVELHVDHIVPFSKGGRCVIENLQTLCSRCNLGKSDEC